MAEIFKARKGSVFVETQGTYRTLHVSGLSGVFNGGNTVLQGFSMSRSEALKFVKTLGDRIYAYSFGENPGQVAIAGTLFLGPSCGGGGGGASMIRTLDRFYSNNRAYSTGKFTSISIGNMSMLVVLTGISISAESSDFDIARFSLNYTRIPEESE